jgi:hypothetical protein
MGPMKIAILRVGIDTGSGGIHGPLFLDGSFEYIPIPDDKKPGLPTYAEMQGKHGRPLIEYFPARLHERMQDQCVHHDPEFHTFTYGDPTSPKAGLRHLDAGDLLVFYCGLQGWDFHSDPALYLMGYFEIALSGRASTFSRATLRELFQGNAHFLRSESHSDLVEEDPVLVKGTTDSRLLKKAVRISTTGCDKSGKPLKILSPAMQKVFGKFDGKLSFQRSPTRWVDQDSIQRAAEFVRSLE